MSPDRPSPIIRDLTSADRLDFIDLMRDAFVADPLFLLAFHRDRYHQQTASFLSFMFDMIRILKGRRRGAFVNGQLVGCSLLEMPRSDGPFGMLRVGLRFLPVAFKLAGPATRLLNDYMRDTRAAAPTRPHHYLCMVGIARNRQGMGLGKALVQDAIAIADADRGSVGLALDTENPDNVSRYQRWGFELVAQVDLGKVEAYCMLRANRGADEGNA